MPITQSKRSDKVGFNEHDNIILVGLAALGLDESLKYSPLRRNDNNRKSRSQTEELAG